jgi:hypothetical protein
MWFSSNQVLEKLGRKVAFVDKQYKKIFKKREIECPF